MGPAVVSGINRPVMPAFSNRSHLSLVSYGQAFPVLARHIFISKKEFMKKDDSFSFFFTR